MSETQSKPRANSGVQRPLAIVILLAAGVVSLPLSASFFDGQDAENYVLPIAFVGMAVIGALVGTILPGIAGSDASPGKARLVGAAVGIGMVVLGTLVFFLLLSGFDGA